MHRSVKVDFSERKLTPSATSSNVAPNLIACCASENRLSQMNKGLPAGTTLSHYRIVSKLGAGGMGEVYLAQDTRFDRKVAIKFLNQEFSKDADKLNRFVQEAKAASALNHPNILTVYEIGEVDGKNYISTELIDGQTLREHLAQKESLQLNQILKIGVQVSEALSAAHQAGIIHRDIKPENIMLRKDGYARCWTSVWRNCQNRERAHVRNVG